MSLDEESLEIAANGGLMDLEKWPDLVEPLLERLEYIIYNAFTMPQMPPEASPTINLDRPPANATASFLRDPNAIPSSSNKENAAPPDLQTPPRPPPSSMMPPSSTERIPDSQPASQAGGTNANLPAPLLLLLDSIRSTIRSLFSSKPPHTIQRLAELILHPNAHYRTLPAYLRALDRVISVTSSADVFPLPAQTGATQPNGVLNGAEPTFVFSDTSLGSDESLGGALLSPIPWLSTASPDADAAAVMDEGPESIQDQQQPMLQAQVPQQQILPTHSGTVNVENDAVEGAASSTEDSEDIPHARGPAVLGVEDLGLQDGKGVQMTLLNTGSENQIQAEGLQSTSSAQPGQGGSENQASTVLGSNENADGDGDIALTDESTVPIPGVYKDQQA